MLAAWITLAFAADPVLDASVLKGPCVGIDAIALVFATVTSGMYDSLTFTNETADGLKVICTRGQRDRPMKRSIPISGSHIRRCASSM